MPPEQEDDPTTPETETGHPLRQSRPADVLPAPPLRRLHGDGRRRRGAAGLLDRLQHHAAAPLDRGGALHRPGPGPGGALARGRRRSPAPPASWSPSPRLALAVAAFFATLIPTIVQQVTQIVEEAPALDHGLHQLGFLPQHRQPVRRAGTHHPGTGEVRQRPGGDGRHLRRRGRLRLHRGQRPVRRPDRAGAEPLLPGRPAGHEEVGLPAGPAVPPGQGRGPVRGNHRFGGQLRDRPGRRRPA